MDICSKLFWVKIILTHSDDILRMKRDKILLIFQNSWIGLFSKHFSRIYFRNVLLQFREKIFQFSNNSSQNTSLNDTYPTNAAGQVPQIALGQVQDCFKIVSNSWNLN